MRESTVRIATADGAMRVFCARPDTSMRLPAIVMYMDAVGFREELKELARLVASRNFSCLLPDLYYRDGEHSFDPYDPRKDGERIKPLVATITRDTILRDTEQLLAAFQGDANIRPGPKGCVGFCMGGRFAMWAAAAFPEDFAAAASFYGGLLGSDATDSPHRYAAELKAEIYLAFAENDPFVPREHVTRFEDALARADVIFESEVFPGTQHGFAFPQRFCYNQTAAEHAWRKIFSLFERRLHLRAASLDDQGRAAANQ